jgi:hypothetical protein
MSCSARGLSLQQHAVTLVVRVPVLCKSFLMRQKHKISRFSVAQQRPVIRKFVIFLCIRFHGTADEGF